MADSEKSVSTEQQPQQQAPSSNNSADAAGGNQPAKVPQAAKEVIGKLVLLFDCAMIYAFTFTLHGRKTYTTGCLSEQSRPPFCFTTQSHSMVLLFCRTFFSFSYSLDRGGTEGRCMLWGWVVVWHEHDIVVWEISVDQWTGLLFFVLCFPFVVSV